MLWKPLDHLETQGLVLPLALEDAAEGETPL